jgi:Tol biopolymer transport system component
LNRNGFYPPAVSTNPIADLRRVQSAKKLFTENREFSKGANMQLRPPIQGKFSIIIFLAIFFLTLTITAPAQDKIAFTSERNVDNGEIYVMNPDGSNQTSLTNDAESFITNYGPSISLNGSRIAFASDREPLFGTNFEVFVMNPDGSNLTRVTNYADFDFAPSLNGDGSKIAFVSYYRDFDYQIYVMNADGSNVTRLTSEGRNLFPSFSPDGSRIAFTRNFPDGSREIYVMNSDGTNQVRLTDNQAIDEFPSFSPDGSRIAFASDRDGNGEIYVMNSDGSNVTRLTSNAAYDSDPAFSPDGSRIAFASDRDGSNFDIYVMNADGSNIIRLTNSPGDDYEPSWGGQATNSAPVLSNLAVSSPISENGTATLSGNISDPNAGDVFSLTVNWGDGSAPQVFNYTTGTVSFSETHQYLDDNPTATASDSYAINLSLNDSAGGNDTDSAVVTVNNLAPVLSDILVTPSTINAGTSATLTGNISDTGIQDAHTVQINWGDGSANTTLSLPAGVSTFNANHPYISSGVFNIGITVIDDDTGSVNGSASVTVNSVPNSPPVLSNVAVTSPINENGTAVLSGNISDPNAGDSFSLTVNWGDGSAPQFFNFPAGGSASFSPTHRYRDDNPTATPFDNYTINLTLNDSNGGSTAGQAVVTVNNLAPVLTNISVSPATITAGNSTTLSGIVTDTGTLDTHAVVIDWGDGTANTTINLAAGASAFSAAHQYDDEGVFNISVAAADDDAGSANAGASVTVNPVPPGGQPKIVFTSGRDNSFGEIYIMNSDGTNPTRLTNNAVSDFSPTLSPDGNKIAFVSFRNGNYDIYLMNPDGTNQVRLTNHPLFEGDPVFSPFGNRIAFISSRDGDSKIYVMNTDGTNQTRLTNTSGSEFTPAFRPDGSKIAFVSGRDGDLELYAINSNGTNQTRLTKHPAADFQPAFSPDGNKLAFVSNRGGNNEIYVMNSDGTNQARLTNNPASDEVPSFSPDGSTIVFQSARAVTSGIYLMNLDGSNPILLMTNPGGDFDPSFRCAPFRSAAQKRIAFFSERDGNREIYVMNPDGTNQVRLTSNPALDDFPLFSPDGSKIVFVSNRSGNFEIYVMNSDGTNQVRLTNNVATDYGPSFSPDGSRIAFSSNRDGNYEIYEMNADGTNQTRLTDNPALDDFPSYSPDGSQIVFVSDRDGYYQIYLMNSDGTNQTRLLNTLGNFSPTFSPDGNRIAFTSQRDGNNEVYVMNRDGTNLTRLTTNPAQDSNPSFSPDGSKIAFVSNRNGVNYEIYVMNSDGKNQSRLTNNPAFDFAPSWGK